jgi:hypothetical protein
MIIGMLVLNLIAYYLNSYWSGRFIGYSTWEQVKDILPSFLLASVIALCVFAAGYLLHVSNPLKLSIQIALGGVLTIGIAEVFFIRDYLYMKEIVIEKTKTIRLVS